MSDSIPIKKLSKRWKMRKYELYCRFVKKGIPIYDDEGNPITPSDVYSKIEGLDPESVEGVNWNNIDLPGNETIANEILDELQDAHFHINQVEGLEKELKLKRERKLDPRQKAKLKCQEIAKRIWKEEKLEGKQLTPIKHMIDDQEIIDASTKKNGQLYVEKTVRGWIKDSHPGEKLKGRPKKHKK